MMKIISGDQSTNLYDFKRTFKIKLYTTITVITGNIGPITCLALSIEILKKS